MTPLQRLAEAVLSDPARARELAEKITARGERDRKAKAARSRVKPAHEAVGRAKGRKKQAETRGAEFYELAKREAAERAGALFGPDGDMAHGPYCEFASPGVVCLNEGIDPDHVIGGAHRKECERLGAAGLMVLCRSHHDLKHASTPSRRFWLDVAERHAERHGFARLAALVAKARARHEAKHPGAAQHPGTKEGETP